MEIGKPQRVYRVEPLKEPLPKPQRREPKPARRPAEPEKVPAR